MSQILTQHSLGSSYWIGASSRQPLRRTSASGARGMPIAMNGHGSGTGGTGGCLPPLRALAALAECRFSAVPTAGRASKANQSTTRWTAQLGNRRVSRRKPKFTNTERTRSCLSECRLRVARYITSMPVPEVALLESHAVGRLHLVEPLQPHADPDPVRRRREGVLAHRREGRAVGCGCGAPGGDHGSRRGAVRPTPDVPGPQPLRRRPVQVRADHRPGRGARERPDPASAGREPLLALAGGQRRAALRQGRAGLCGARRGPARARRLAAASPGTPARPTSCAPSSAGTRM
jgi:hypothetical protein